MKVTVLVGGVGGARFLLGGVQHLLGGLGQFGTEGQPQDEHELTAVVNVGDDAWMFGVRICPDLDTCMYTLGGGIDPPERGWGHRNETWHAKEELAATGFSRIGSAWATAIWPLTWCAARCCVPATHCRR